VKGKNQLRRKEDITQQEDGLWKEQIHGTTDSENYPWIGTSVLLHNCIPEDNFGIGS
jgi:hypothetical protein